MHRTAPTALDVPHGYHARADEASYDVGWHKGAWYQRCRRFAPLSGLAAARVYDYDVIIDCPLSSVVHTLDSHAYIVICKTL